MSYNGSGTFQINTAGQPVVSGTVISSTAFNALTADLATGLSTCITKDGQTTVTANIPMGNNKITGLAVGTAATDAANLSQVQSTAAKLINSVSGADTVTGVLSPTLGAYAAGQMFYWVAAGDNTGAVTLNIDSLGAKSVTRDGSVALAAGDIKSGEVVVVVYDGTRFQVVSQLNSAGDARFANVSIASALNVGGVATVTGGSVLNGGVVINEPGANADTRIEGDTDQNLVFVDASADAVGIGTSTPVSKLEIYGAFSTGTTAATLSNSTAFSASNIARIDFKLNNSFGGLERCAAVWALNPNAAANNGGALVFGTSANGSSTTPTERGRFNSDGDFLVGTTANATSDWLSTIPAEVVSKDNNAQLRLHRPSQGSGVGVGGLLFAGNDGSSNQKDVAAIRAETTTTFADGGLISFLTRPNAGSLTSRAVIKSTGQVRFVPLVADPAGAEAGDVYYNSSTNKLRVYNGTAWVDLH